MNARNAAPRAVAARERGLSAWDAANSTTDGTAEPMPVSVYSAELAALGFIPAAIFEAELLEQLSEYLGGAL